MSDTSIQDGSPVYKYLFALGATEYRYTSAATDLTDGSGTFTAESINTTDIIVTNELAKNGIQVTMPRDNPVAQLFQGKSPEQKLSLTVYRSHDPTQLGDVHWKGRVIGSTADGEARTLMCEDVFTSMRRTGLRGRYQKSCRYALYSPKCGVDRATFAIAATIESENGFDLTITALGSPPGNEAGYFSGGVIELADGSMRYIMSHAGTTLTLSSAFNDLTIGGGLACTLYPGCNHTTTHCKDRFSNLLNYGGYPYIPGKNPFQNSVTGSIA